MSDIANRLKYVTHGPPRVFRPILDPSKPQTDLTCLTYTEITDSESNPMKIHKYLADLLCWLGIHDWSGGPGKPCVHCGQPDDFWFGGDEPPCS